MFHPSFEKREGEIKNIRKFSLKFTFGQGNCCKSDSARYLVFKAILLKILLDWSFS